MQITDATRHYEAWLAQQTSIVPADLTAKHQAMAAPHAVFPFLRATFYRWLQLWLATCPELATAPPVLAVGDLHVENFGTWRDAEGRLIWGVNDFDEACVLSYTHDLVRLATSALLAIQAGHLSLPGRGACDALLKGYADGLAEGGRPYVLEAQHHRLRTAALGELRDPAVFWPKLDALPTIPAAEVPTPARQALEGLLPEPGLAYRVVHRQAGLGSLGRQRWTAIATWGGGPLAREVKALVPSAYWWVHPNAEPDLSAYQALLDRAVRVPDPFVRVAGRWIVRRLAPDCSRIELAALPAGRDETRLLRAMGRETANVHLGSPAAVPAVQQDLAHRGEDWLHAAAKAMAAVTENDWQVWREAARHA